MRSVICCLFLLAAVSIADAQQVVQFHISKPLAVYTFLETLIHNNGTSPTLYKYIREHTPVADTAAVNRLTTAFRSVDLGPTNADRGLPVQRQRPRDARVLVKATLAAARDIKEWSTKPIKGFAEAEHQKLVRILQEAESYYDKIIWNQNKEPLQNQLEQLQQHAAKLDEVFARLKKFYGSNWPAEKPFKVYVYPIPGKNGASSATPYNDILILNMFTQETDYHSRLGVAIHEMSHMLYEYQPHILQHRLDSAFQQSSSAYAAFAYNYLDEGLATACGNAWAYQFISGRADTGAWYNDEVIDRYAHALYPLVERYINEGRTIDKAFIALAIEAYEKEFPDAIYTYRNLVNSVHLYTDAETTEEYKTIIDGLHHHFNISSSYSSYPILDKQSLSAAKTTDGTQWFIVHTNNTKNINELKNIFPELKTVDPKKEALISFLDKSKRAIIILNVHGIPRIDKALALMQQEKMIKGDMVVGLE